MDKLQIHVRPHPDGYEVQATLVEREFLPERIFSYLNTGMATLGEYTGVVSALDVDRRSPWLGVAIPSFGNKYVVHDSVTQVFKDQETADRFAANILKGAQSLKDARTARPLVSNIYTL